VAERLGHRPDIRLPMDDCNDPDPACLDAHANVIRAPPDRGDVYLGLAQEFNIPLPMVAHEAGAKQGFGAGEPRELQRVECGVP